jgi:hypothetical protein
MSCSVVSDFIALRDVNPVNHAESVLPGKSRHGLCKLAHHRVVCPSDRLNVDLEDEDVAYQMAESGDFID